MIFDFIIIGAGMAGASLAYELAPHGRVCLLEGEDRPGVHATGRSAALFAPTYGGPAIRAITRASRAFFDAPPKGFCDRPLLEARGCLYPAREDQRDQLNRMVETIHVSGGHVSVVSRDEALAMVPLLRRDYLVEAVLDRDAMDIDVDALHQGYLRAARTRGAVLKTESRLAAARYGAGSWSVPVADGVAQAPILINAAGAWADQVAKACGARPLELRALRRTALLVDAPSGVDIRTWPAVIDVDEQFYFKPDAGKLLLSPADETPDEPGDAQPDEMDIAIGVDRVQQALDIEVRRVTHSWAGLRTFTPDRAPAVGFDAELPGFFWCAGQGGYGIQTAPAMARLAASLVRGKPLPDDVVEEGLRIDELAPARFATASTLRFDVI
jgi:D-arginine dehydrogenase